MTQNSRPTSPENVDIRLPKDMNRNVSSIIRNSPKLEATQTPIHSGKDVRANSTSSSNNTSSSQLLTSLLSAQSRNQITAYHLSLFNLPPAEPKTFLPPTAIIPPLQKPRDLCC